MKTRKMHVIPVGRDEPPHIAAGTCWCQPAYPYEGPSIHRAKDKREAFERQGMTLPDSPWVLVIEEKE